MKFYNIKDEYINYLKKYDAKVADNKKGKRPYVGVVLEIEGIKYYTPFTLPKEKHRKMKNTKDFRKIDRIQRSLLQGYQYDIAHYATAEEKVKAEKCYISLAKQLLDKENHKFQYKEVEPLFQGDGLDIRSVLSLL